MMPHSLEMLKGVYQKDKQERQKILYWTLAYKQMQENSHFKAKNIYLLTWLLFLF